MQRSNLAPKENRNFDLVIIYPTLTLTLTLEFHFWFMYHPLPPPPPPLLPPMDKDGGQGVNNLTTLTTTPWYTLESHQSRTRLLISPKVRADSCKEYKD